MALGLFRRLTKVKPAVAPSVGKIFNPMRKPVAPVVRAIPATNPVRAAAVPVPRSVTAMTGTKLAAARSVLARATHPKPEQPTTATPNHLIHRAIRNVAATVRQPDRGAFMLKFGVASVLPDGSLGGSPVTPKPLQNRLAAQFHQVVATGGTAQVRQTQLTTLIREGYLERARARPVVARIGNMMRRGIVQRPGMAIVLKPFPSGPGALDKAKMHRRKTGTPTGIQGDRELMNPTSHVGSLHARTVAPSVTNAVFVGSLMGGAGTATAPVPLSPAVIDAPNVAVSDSVRKAFAWAPPKGESALADAPASSGKAPDTAGEGMERILLLVAVAGAAFLLLRR